MLKRLCALCLVTLAVLPFTAPFTVCDFSQMRQRCAPHAQTVVGQAGQLPAPPLGASSDTNTVPVVPSVRPRTSKVVQLHLPHAGFAPVATILHERPSNVAQQTAPTLARTALQV